MANIFDTSGSVEQVTRNETPIMGGVVDKTAARALGAVVDVANEATKQVVTNQVTDQVKNVLETPETQTLPPEVEENLARLDGVANGVKAGMQKRKAQMMARSIAAEAINQHPYYAKEIRNRLSSLFGGGSTGLGGGAKIEETPQEQAMNAYEKNIAELQLNMGITRETAQELIKNKTDNQFRSIRAANFRDDLYVSTSEITDQTQQTLYKALQETQGKGFSPEQIHQLGMEVDRSAINLQKTLFNKAAERGAITDKIASEINSQVKAYKTSMKSLLEDSTAQKWIQQNTDLATSMIENRGVMKYGGIQWLAKNQLLSDADKTALWGALRGDARAEALLDASPQLQGVVDAASDLTGGLRKAYNFGLNIVAGQYPDPEERRNAQRTNQITDDQLAASLTITLNNSRAGANQNLSMLKEGNQAQAQELIDLSLKKAPESIRRWSDQNYINAFASDKELMNRTIDHELDVVSRALRSSIVADGGDWNDITFSEPRAQMEEIGGGSSFYGPQASAPEFLVSGDIPDATKSRIYDIYKVLKEHPQLWENKFDSPAEYVEGLIKRPPDWKYPRRVRQQKVENLDGGNEVDNGINFNNLNS